MTNGPDLIAIRLGGRALAERVDRVWQAGDAVLPIDPATTPPEMHRILTSMRPAALMTAGGVEGLPNPLPAKPGTAAVLLTSGTSGEAKGVELSHDALEASARAGLERIGAGGADRWLACVGLQHVAGLSILVRSRVSGSDPVIHDRFDVETFEQEREVQLVSLVPRQLQRLLDARAVLERFKAILVGGAPAPEALVRRGRDAGANLVLTYGMTETCGGCVYDGRPLDGVEVRIAEDDEIAIRGEVLMTGYRLQDEFSAYAMRDGWFRTSDAGAFDDAGTLQVLGRLDDLIITGGKNVSPAEVEAILHEHPKVGDVAVLGRPDAEWGQRVVAFVVAPEGTLSAELAEFVAGRLSSYKVPKEFVFVSSIPRNANGKVDRAALP